MRERRQKMFLYLWAIGEAVNACRVLPRLVIIPEWPRVDFQREIRRTVV